MFFLFCMLSPSCLPLIGTGLKAKSFSGIFTLPLQDSWHSGRKHWWARGSWRVIKVTSQSWIGDVAVSRVFNCLPVMMPSRAQLLTGYHPGQPSRELSSGVSVTGMHLSHKALLCNYQPFSWWPIRLASWPNCTAQGVRNIRAEWSNCRLKRKREGPSRACIKVFRQYKLPPSATTSRPQGASHLIW